jgi:serine/threonine protein phosphatase PrpC
MGGHQEGSFASHLVTDIFEKVRVKGSFEKKVEIVTSQLNNIHLLLQKKVKKVGLKAVIGTTVVVLVIDGQKGAVVYAGDSRCYLYRQNKLSLITLDHAQEVQTDSGIRKVLTNALFAPGDANFEVKKFKVQDGDIFLLCSDGAYENLNVFQIKQILQQSETSLAMQQLAKNVLAKRARDNLTAIIIKNKGNGTDG